MEEYRGSNIEYRDFSVLVGQTIEKILVSEEKDVLFIDTATNEYILFHEQDCCERVELEDVAGDLSDLIGHPVTMAEVVTEQGKGGKQGRYTWTFYKLATNKGYVTIRWYGESSGWYSEKVDFAEIFNE